MAEYEAVRADSALFVAAPGHIWEPGVEREVRRTERYSVLRKLGDAREQAEALDPRADG